MNWGSLSGEINVVEKNLFYLSTVLEFKVENENTRSATGLVCLYNSSLWLKQISPFYILGRRCDEDLPVVMWSTAPANHTVDDHVLI